MVSITVGVDEETRKLMKKFPEMNWSGFIRKTIQEKAKELSKKEQLLALLEKELFIEDLVDGKKVNAAVAQKLKKLL